MDENIFRSLDREYEQFIEIIKPHIFHLSDKRLASVCTAWIERLSACKDQEKLLRNKYIITLCYQLSKGNVGEPFLKEPDDDEPLLPIFGPTLSEISSHAEYPALDSEEVDSVLNTVKLQTKEWIDDGICKFQIPKTNDHSLYKQIIYNNNYPEIQNYKDTGNLPETYGYRTSNIIKRLREIKKQNALMHNELQELKEPTFEGNYADERFNNNSPSFYKMRVCDSNSYLGSAKSKSKEVQDTRNEKEIFLMEKIQCMQEHIDTFNEIKSKEMEEIYAKHKLEIINVKSSTTEEITHIFEGKLNDQKQEYESKIKELQNKNKESIELIMVSKNNIIEEKDKIIQQKETEILRISEQIKDNKENLHSILKNMQNKHNEEHHDKLLLQNQTLEKRINKMEKARTKYIKAYESKLASLQREKSLMECSFQIQLVRQRAQIVSDVANNYQQETKRAVDKLEAKYQDIVAHMQATAIQRRLEDQMAVASILQAASGIQTDTYGFSPSVSRNTQHLKRDQSPYFNNETALFQANKIYRKVIPDSNKTFKDENACHRELDMLYKKVYVPQRDTNDKAQKYVNNLKTMPL